MFRSTTSRLFFLIAIAFSLISCKKEMREQGEQAASPAVQQPEQQVKEQEREVAENEMPAAVLQAFKSAYPGATVRGYSEEIEEGETFHEVSFEFEGKKLDVVYYPDGKVKVAETVIAHDQLPDAARQAIAKEFPQSAIELAERLEKDGKIFFEARVLNKQDEKRFEMVFSESGALIESKLITEQVVKD